MSQSFRALGLLGLAFVGLWYSVGGHRALPATDSSETVSQPLAHENLCVYFVYGPDAVAGTNVLTLQEALERELAVVHETSAVNTFAVENRSPDCDLFIQSGDIVKGGKQDRMIASDMLVPPGSGRVPLPAHCVEQGRWTNRGTENALQFQKSDTFAAGKELKYANANFQQSAVWQTVSENQSKLRMNVAANVTENASPTSFQLTIEAPAVKAKIAEYEAALRAAGDRANVVGVVFVVNGAITGAEVYGSNALFRKAWPKLLNAAAVEAVAERTDVAPARVPTARAIERFLARGADPEPTGASLPVANTDLRQVRNLFGVHAGPVGVNAEEEVFRTEGGAALGQAEGLAALGQAARPAPQTEGRQPGRRTGQLVFGGSVNSDAGLTGNVQNIQTETVRPARFANVPLSTPLFDPTAQQNRPLTTSGVAGVAVDNVGSVVNRARVNQASMQLDRPAPPVNPTGNRLDSNRTENRSTLMVESRDPARQNAVIHRSYIKK